MDILINKSYRSYNRLSRYNNFPYYYNKVDNKYVSGTVRHLKNTTSYILHTVEKNDTYDSLALKYYNNPTYYWIICDYNRILDPFTTIKVGSQIAIPLMSEIDFED